MNFHLALTTTLAAALALPASALELVPGWEARTTWRSNVFATSADEEQGFAVGGGPRLNLRERKGDLTFDVAYEPLGELYFDVDDANSLEHFVKGRATWVATRRTRLEVTQTLAVVESIARLRELDDPADPFSDFSGDLAVGQEELLRQRGSMSLSHRLTPRLLLQGILSSSIADFDDRDRFDSIGLNASLQLSRTFTERLRAGGGASVTRQDFESDGLAVENGTLFFQGFGLVSYDVSPTVSLSLQAGPSWAMPDDTDESRNFNEYTLLPAGPNGGFLKDVTTCGSLDDGQPFDQGCGPAQVFVAGTNIPAFQPVLNRAVERVPVRYTGQLEEPGDSLNLFGRISLVKRWERARMNLSYERRANNASGIGSSTNLDVARASLNWDVRRRWRILLQARWERQVSTSESPSTRAVFDPTGQTVFLTGDGRIVDAGDPDAAFEARDVARTTALVQRGLIDDAIELETFSASIRVDHRLTQVSKLFGVFRWGRQDASGEVQRGDTIEGFRVFFGVDWEFDPIQL